MIKVFNIIIITFITIIIFIPQTLAVDSTPSADIKLKLQDFKNEIASKAAKLKQEVSQKLQNKAYVGKIETKTSTSLTLATAVGPKIVTINQDTNFPKKMAKEDFVASLGDIDDTAVLTAKKIVLVTAPNQPKATLWGQIVSISDKLATLKDRNLKNIAITVPNSNVKLNDFVILTGNFGKKDIFEARFVYVIPQGGILKPKREATASAKPKPIFR